MSAGTFSKVGTLTIPNGQSVSAALAATDYHGAIALSITAPAALTNTVTLEAADAETSPNYRTVQSPPGTDLSVGAGKSIVLLAFPWPGFRLKSSGNEGADRVFVIWAQFPRN